jgi:PPOX class probable F420-dependent enzyme
MNPLAEEEYVALTTFRRDGRPVTTAVWTAPDGADLVLWTPARSGKVARLRHTDDVRLAPCDRAGTVTGPSISGKAQVLDGAGLDRVRHAMTAKYGWKFREFAALISFVRLTRLHRLLRTGRVRRAAGGAVAVRIILDTPLQTTP